MRNKQERCCTVEKENERKREHNQHTLSQQQVKVWLMMVLSKMPPPPLFCRVVLEHHSLIPWSVGCFGKGAMILSFYYYELSDIQALGSEPGSRTTALGANFVTSNSWVTKSGATRAEVDRDVFRTNRATTFEKVMVLVARERNQAIFVKKECKFISKFENITVSFVLWNKALVPANKKDPGWGKK